MAQSATLLGDRWKLLILRSALYGVSRFEDLQHELKISRGILSNKLSALVEHGLLATRTYQDPGSRERIEYTPTEATKDLLLVFLAWQQWGDKWLRRKPPALQPRKRVTGEPVRVAFATAAGKVVDAEDVTMSR